jgi:hypothetical protein
LTKPTVFAGKPTSEKMEPVLTLPAPLKLETCEQFVTGMEVGVALEPAVGVVSPLVVAVSVVVGVWVLVVPVALELHALSVAVSARARVTMSGMTWWGGRVDMECGPFLANRRENDG